MDADRRSACSELVSPRARLLIEQLHASLGRLVLAVSLARDAKVWTDDDGNVVWCNPAFERLVGEEHIALLGTPVTDRLPLRRDGRIVAPEDYPLRRALDRSTSLTETYELSLGGRDRILDVYAAPDQIDGEPYCVAVIVDITERVTAQRETRRANARLEAVNRELESFSYSVSHDLRAPLRAIDGFSHVLLEDYDRVLDATGKDYLRRLRAAAQDMGRLIDDMLRLSRVTRGDMVWTDVDLSAQAREIIDELAASDPQRRVAVSIQSGLLARGDEGLIRQALANLLDNAWKFTGKTERPTIEVGAMIQEGERVFFVRDNGAGFDAERAGKLFGAFQRLHTSDEFPGLGIGLAIVRKIVHRHGGRVWAESTASRGATFYFTLPAKEQVPR